MASVLSRARVSSPAASFSQLLLSQDIDQPQPLSNITREDSNRQNQDDPPKKVKRTRLLLDARTELTDDELKVFT
jgi:meiotic recombination protein REC8